MRYLIYKNRTNAGGSEFHSLYAMTLDELKDYSSNAKGSTIQAAINSLNREWSRRYRDCTRQNCTMEIIGTADCERFDITKNSKESLEAAAFEKLGSQFDEIKMGA